MKYNKVLLVNGPNLNMLGKREGQIYGNETLDFIEKQVVSICTKDDLEVVCFQSNIEGEICTFLQNNLDAVGVIINPGAYTHVSIAILDALKIIKNNPPDTLIVEVHLSNTKQREEFRHNSYISLVADAVISGMKADGYFYAAEFIVKNFAKNV